MKFESKFDIGQAVVERSEHTFKLTRGYVVSVTFDTDRSPMYTARMGHMGLVAYQEWELQTVEEADAEIEAYKAKKEPSND